MTRFEATKLVEEIGRRWWREYRAVLMWHEPGSYKVIVTRKASNTQTEVFDPDWTPDRKKVTA